MQHTDHMAKWREYQEESAELFRSLGLEATTDERLEGTRGQHDVDVVVRSRRAGLDQLWIVECKRRNRRVEKLHVAALAQIVSDVGADRGILLSEVGFQSGAVRLASKSNVTLTCLADLRVEAAEELLMLRLGECRRRLHTLHERTLALGDRTTTLGPRTSSVRSPIAPGHWEATKVLGAIALAEQGAQLAEIGRWPAPYAWDFATEATHIARDLTSFVAGLTDTLGEIESEVAALEAAKASSGKTR